MNAERLSEVRQYAIQAIKEETESTLKLIDQLDDNFDRAVELMFRCNGKVIVTGVGKSGHIGAKIAATLSSTGTPAFFVNPLDAYHGDLGVIGKEDVVLALSNSGQTDELLRFIPIVLHMNIPIIGISANPASLLAKFHDCRACQERCVGNCSDASAKFQAAGFCTLSSWRRTRETAPYNSKRCYANRRPADNLAKHSSRQSHHQCEQRKIGAWSVARRWEDSGFNNRR